MGESLLFYIVLLVPIIASSLCFVIINKTVLHSINLAAAIITNIAFGNLAFGMIRRGAEFINLPFQFYLDRLSVMMLGIVLFIGLMVSIYSVGFVNKEFEDGKFDIKKVKLYYALYNVFVWTMIVAVTAGNVGVMWVFIEATTLASVFLVGFYKQKSSIEAAWKYLIICSVGIALALLGIIFLHISSIDFIKNTRLELYWPYLRENAGSLQISALRLSFIFILLGFGTKAGLAPMHTWLPDAHSQAPAPISAMLSGVLLNTAMYGIIRELILVNQAMGSSRFAGRLMMAVGLLSILIAAVFLIRQKDYKRLLAYSSIEHMGIIAFGLGIFTPAAVFAVLYHTINHSLTKSMLFMASGNVYQKYHSKETVKIRRLLSMMPITGCVFLVGIFAVTGMPPFSVFSSELSIIISAFEARAGYSAVIFIALLAAVFAGFAVSLLKMFYGNDSGKGNGVAREMKSGEVNKAGTVVICVLLVMITVTGLYLPQGLIQFLMSVQHVITGANDY